MDEKGTLGVLNSMPVRKRGRPKLLFTLIACFTAIGFWAWFYPDYQIAISIAFKKKPHKVKETPKDFAWDDVEPSPQLKFTPCFDGFQCARLQVPLDYNATDLETTPKAAIAIIKRPALVEVTSPQYGGPILLNPGGPGGSGVSFVLQGGMALQTIVDSRSPSAEAKYFDIVSFDPRGINNTTPWSPGISDPGIRREYMQRQADFGFALDEEAAFNKAFDLYRLYGKLISSPDHGELDNGEHVSQFVGTSYVARDMLEIVERLGEWRAREGFCSLHCGCEPVTCCDPILPDYPDPMSYESVIERTAWRKGEEKIQYWGFSYGTLLGQTFASQYPERIGRFVLDGVANMTDYYAGDWLTPMYNSEDINANFTAACAAAGPSICPMAEWLSSFERVSSSPSDLLTSLRQHLRHLKSHPVTSLFSHSQVPTFVSHSDTILLLFQLHYNGWIGYRIAARVLWELSQGDPTFFYETRPPPLHCPLPNSTYVDPLNDPKDHWAAGQAVICTDASESLQNMTKDDWKQRVAILKNTTETFFGYGSSITLPCGTFSQRPKWRFAGPWGASEDRLANPILFVSQTLDPITPLRSAEGAAASFAGSGLVEAQGVGHCSFGWPNVCAMERIRAYFRTGEVDKDRVYCPGAVGPFETEGSVEERIDSMKEGAQKELLRAVVSMGKQWPPSLETGGY